MILVLDSLGLRCSYPDDEHAYMLSHSVDWSRACVTRTSLHYIHLYTLFRLKRHSYYAYSYHSLAAQSKASAKPNLTLGTMLFDVVGHLHSESLALGAFQRIPTPKETTPESAETANVCQEAWVPAALAQTTCDFTRWNMLKPWTPQFAKRNSPQISGTLGLRTANSMFRGGANSIVGIPCNSCRPVSMMGGWYFWWNLPANPAVYLLFCSAWARVT